MKGLKIGLLIFAAVLLILFIVGLLLPGNYEVKRSITLQANSQTVLDSLLNLKTWPQWSPWRKDDDPTLEFRTSGPKAMPGYTLHWQSEMKGTGKIEIKQINQAEGLQYELESGGETLVQNGFLQIEAQGESTQLTWTVTGHLGGSPIMRWAGLFIDGSIGPAYQQSLEDFKERVE